MGLGDVTDSVKEELDEWDDEDLKDLADDLDEYLDQVKNLRRVVVNLDSRMEDISENMESVEKRTRVIEAAIGVEDNDYVVLTKDEYDEMSEGGGSATDTTDDSTSSWNA